MTEYPTGNSPNTPPATPTSGSGGKTHTVATGDTCNDIAKKYSMDVAALMKMNNM